MNNVKCFYIYKMLFFQFFNSPVALKNKNCLQEKVEMTPLFKGPWTLNVQGPLDPWTLGPLDP